MAKVRYLLKDGSSLDIAWTGDCENLTLTWNDQFLANFRQRFELEAGRRFPLDGGRGVLEVRVQDEGLKVWHNGELLRAQLLEKDSFRRPLSAAVQHDMAASAGALGFVAVANVLLGLVVVLLRVDFLEQLGVGWGNVLFGMLFAVLAFLTGRGWAIAALVGLLLFAADAVFSLVLATKLGGVPPIGGLLLRGYLLMQMSRGLSGFSGAGRKVTT